MKKIILMAIVCYFLIAPFSYHPDTKLTLRYPALENGSVWDIYGYIDNHELDISDFHYPPAHYWWLKIHYPISKIIGGQGFDNWLTAGSAQASFSENVLRYNLAAKFPLLVLGILSGWIIFLIVNKASGDSNKAKIAALIWYFNPITLYSLVVMGQNDVVAIFLFLLGMLFYKKWWLAVPFWGLASGVKNYPIIWAVMFMLIWEKKIIKLVSKFSFLIVVYGLILLPWLNKDYFIQAVFKSGLSQRMFTANIPIGFDKQILIAPLLLVIVALNAWKQKKKNKILLASFVIFQSCLLILGFSHFNPQWMLWIVPFLSIWMSMSTIGNNDLLVILAIFVSWFLLILGFDDRFLTWGLLTPINPGLINFPSLVEFVRNKGGDLSGLINLSQTALAGIAIWYLGKKVLFKNLRSVKIKMNKWLIFIPWLMIVLIGLLLSNLKIDNAIYSQMGDKDIYLIETIDKKWIYDISSNLRYFEISLDNLGLASEDKAVLMVSDNKGNEFEKEFSGFNAGVNSWLRVDVPKAMSGSDSLSLETKDVVIHDGLLKIKLDSNSRWAVNFYNESKAPIVETINKLNMLWWWWVVLIGISVSYFKIKED